MKIINYLSDRKSSIWRYPFPAYKMFVYNNEKRHEQSQTCSSNSKFVFTQYHGLKDLLGVGFSL